MNITRNSVVSFHYALADADGQELESSRGSTPIRYLHGAGSIVPGLEQALEGRAAGDRFQVTLAPAEAYGERRPGSVRRIPSKHFREAGKLRPGQRISLQTRQGPMQVTVVKVGRFNIDVDANHPLAGRTLTFEVEVLDVREATADERAHGHVHGPGGFEH